MGQKRPIPRWGRPKQLGRADRHDGRRLRRWQDERQWGWVGPGWEGTCLRRRKIDFETAQRLAKAAEGKVRVVESKWLPCSGGGFAGTGWRRDVGCAGEGGLLTDTSWEALTSRTGCSNGGGTKRSHCRPATGSRTPNPADHKADKAARPAGEFASVISRKSHLRKRRKAVRWPRQRGCAAYARKHRARVGSIAGDTSSSELSPGPALLAFALARQARMPEVGTDTRQKWDPPDEILRLAVVSGPAGQSQLLQSKAC